MSTPTCLLAAALLTGAAAEAKVKNPAQDSIRKGGSSSESSMSSFDMEGQSLLWGPVTI